jgi:hypothetical protein
MAKRVGISGAVGVPVSNVDPHGNRVEFYAQLMPGTEAKRYLHTARVADDVLRPLDLEAPSGSCCTTDLHWGIDAAVACLRDRRFLRSC